MINLPVELGWLSENLPLTDQASLCWQVHTRLVVYVRIQAYVQSIISVNTSGLSLSGTFLRPYGKKYIIF